MIKLNIYVASSWRNIYQPETVETLRALGHEVYDFRNPAPGDHGFAWKQVHPKPCEEWTLPEYLEALDHPIAQEGFRKDFEAMERANCCVLVLPSGASAHLEAGWFSGAQRPVLIYAPNYHGPPELMYKALRSVGSAKLRVVWPNGTWFSEGALGKMRVFDTIETLRTYFTINTEVPHPCSAHEPATRGSCNPCTLFIGHTGPHKSKTGAVWF